MTTIDNDSVQQPIEETVPVEAIPQLSTPEAISMWDRLLQLKKMEDDLFRRADAKKGDPGGEYVQLKQQLAAMALVSGHKSVSFLDLRLTNVEGGEVKAKLTGAALIEQYEKNSEVPMSYEKLRAIALAAKDCDPKTAMQYGISAVAIEGALASERPERRASSVRVEWIGKKGFVGTRRVGSEPVQ